MTTGAMTSGERINYLSLALRARGAIQSLKTLSASHQPVLIPSGELQHYLETLVLSFKSFNSSRPGQSALAGENPYRPFEEEQTIDEVAALFKGADVVSQLEALLEGACQDDDIKTAIRICSAVEKRALYHYHDPSWSEPGI
jgi:hypothetical protein